MFLIIHKSSPLHWFKQFWFYCNTKLKLTTLGWNTKLYSYIQGAPKTPQGFWNLKTSVPVTRRFHTNRHHVQWCLEFSWWSAGQFNTALRQWNCLSKQGLLQLHSMISEQQFPRCDAPSHNTLLLWISKWHQEVSVKDCTPHGCPCWARTPDNVEQVRDAILQSPSHREHGVHLQSVIFQQ